MLGIPVPLVYQIHFSPTFGEGQDRAVFQTSPRGLLRSTDGAESWALVHRNPGGGSAGTQWTVAVLGRAAGASASVVVLALARKPYAPAPYAPAPWWAPKGQQQTWPAARTPLTASHSLWVSRDGGDSFTGAWPPRPAAAGAPECTAIHADAGHAGFVYAGCQSARQGRHTTPALLASFDAGATWLHVCDLPAGQVVTSIAPIHRGREGGLPAALTLFGLLVSTYGSAGPVAAVFSVRFTYTAAEGIRVAGGGPVPHDHAMREPGGAPAPPGSGAFAVASTPSAVPLAPRVLYILPRLGSAVMRSRDAGASWHRASSRPTATRKRASAARVDLDTLALHIYAEADMWNATNFTHVVGCRVDPRVVFVGGYEGLHKSTDSGKTWRKLEIQSRILSSLSVAPASDGGSEVLVAVCTYAGGCFTGLHDAGAASTAQPRAAAEMAPLRYDHDKFAAVKPRTGSALEQRLGGRPFRMPLADASDYNVAVVSPGYANDRLIIVFTSIYMFWTTDRGGSWMASSVPGRLCTKGVTQAYPGYSVSQYLGGRITTVVFSPRHAADGAVYIAGINMGVSVTRDRGATHSLLFSRDCTAAHAGTMWTYYVSAAPAHQAPAVGGQSSGSGVATDGAVSHVATALPAPWGANASASANTNATSGDGDVFGPIVGGGNAGTGTANTTAAAPAPPADTTIGAGILVVRAHSTRNLGHLQIMGEFSAHVTYDSGATWMGLPGKVAGAGTGTGVLEWDAVGLSPRIGEDGLAAAVVNVVANRGLGSRLLLSRDAGKTWDYVRNVRPGELGADIKLAYLASGELEFLGSGLRGGFARGTINMTSGFPVAENVTVAQQSRGGRDGATTLSTIDLRPPARFALIRSVGELLQPSPGYGTTHRVLFGGSVNSVIMSTDGGETWRDIFTTEGTRAFNAACVQTPIWHSAGSS